MLTGIYYFAYPSLRKLEGVIAKLDPLSDQHVFVGFLCNADNATTLTGFVQELANAVTDYQVWATSPTAIFNEHQARSQHCKEYIKGQGTSSVIPRTSLVKQRTTQWGDFTAQI